MDELVRASKFAGKGRAGLILNIGDDHPGVFGNHVPSDTCTQSLGTPVTIGTFCQEGPCSLPVCCAKDQRLLCQGPAIIAGILRSALDLDSRKNSPVFGWEKAGRPQRGESGHFFLETTTGEPAAYGLPNCLAMPSAQEICYRRICTRGSTRRGSSTCWFEQHERYLIRLIRPKPPIARGEPLFEKSA